MGRGLGQDQAVKARSLLFARSPRRRDFAAVLRDRDERLFVEVFGQEFREELATLAERTVEAGYPEGHGRTFKADAPRRCDRSYREDVKLVPEVEEAGEDLVFDVYVYFPTRPGWSGPVLDRRTEISFTPDELAGLGWTSEAFRRRCREEALKGTEG